MAGLYRATRTFSAGHRVVRKGIAVVEGEPPFGELVHRHPDCFERIGTADAPVEDASARPGVKRSTRRREV